MKERPIVPIPPEPEPAVRPSYEQISNRLTTLLETAGCAVREDFPQFAPRGAMSAYDHATRALVLHPWIAPRARTDALLRETVNRLTEQQTKRTRKRGKDAQEPREWIVQDELARRYGLAPEEPRRRGVEVTIAERSLIDQIVGAVEGPGEQER